MHLKELSFSTLRPSSGDARIEQHLARGQQLLPAAAPNGEAVLQRQGLSAGLGRHGMVRGEGGDFNVKFVKENDFAFLCSVLETAEEGSNTEACAVVNCWPWESWPKSRTRPVLTISGRGRGPRGVATTRSARATTTKWPRSIRTETGEAEAVFPGLTLGRFVFSSMRHSFPI